MGYRAVIADDENKVRLALKVLADWEKLGISLAAEYEDGDSLCSHLQEECPDIVITDMKMPGIHGAELIEALGNSNPDMEPEFRIKLAHTKNITQYFVGYLCQHQTRPIFLSASWLALLQSACYLRQKQA